MTLTCGVVPVRVGGRGGSRWESCATCPVLLPCRAYTIVRREVYGVWGGLSERDRARVLGDSDPVGARKSIAGAELRVRRATHRAT